MAEPREITTRTAKIWLGNDNIVRKIFLENAEETLADAWESSTAINELTLGKKLPLMVDFTPLRSIDPEARSFYASKDAFEVISAAAAVTKSRISRVIGNFFLGFNKPEYPRRLFNDEDSALEWLKQFNNK